MVMTTVEVARHLVLEDIKSRCRFESPPNRQKRMVEMETEWLNWESYLLQQEMERGGKANICVCMHACMIE
jgi:hypothetical protein